MYFMKKLFVYVCVLNTKTNEILEAIFNVSLALVYLFIFKCII